MCYEVPVLWRQDRAKPIKLHREPQGLSPIHRRGPCVYLFQCGEKYYEEEQVEAIQKLIRKVEVEIDKVRKYAEAKGH